MEPTGWETERDELFNLKESISRETDNKGYTCVDTQFYFDHVFWVEEVKNIDTAQCGSHISRFSAQYT